MRFQFHTFILAIIVAVSACTQAFARDRTLEHEAIIDAPATEVWRMFATSEGAKQWMAPKVEVDLRVGGSIRSSYHPDSNLHDEHTIVNRILAYEPGRMVSMRNVQAPAGFPNVDQFQQTWSVMYFEPISERQTRLRIVGLGWGEGPEWDDLYAFFEVGNQQVLNLLKSRFDASRENDADIILAMLGRLVGGEWIHESERSGGIFRVRNVAERGGDGVSLVTKSWLGTAEGMYDHGRTIIYRAPKSEGGGVRFLNINEMGAVAQGPIRLVAPDRIEWEWKMTTLEGAQRTFRVSMAFGADRDEHTFKLERREDDGSWREQIAISYTRVDEAPERFKKLRAQE
ncbi:MAG TPA: SRPBCC domain-containing protein [Phycisphaerales bacterium]|nr:SRPBCC domain-containing protein [Phycisphaerales bacterium]